MKVSALYDKHQGEDIYVLGTGPSNRFFPFSLLEGRTVIGLNQAWRYFPCTYSLTIHPELVQEYEKTTTKHDTQWVVRGGKKPLYLQSNSPRYYVFESAGPKRAHEEHFHRRRSEHLWISRGIQAAACSLAAKMGARCVFLVGVDLGDLCGEHHGHDQHTRFCGLQSGEVYREMRSATDNIRQMLRDEYGVPVLSLTPFIGLTAAEEEVGRLTEQLELDPLPPAPELAHRARQQIDIFTYRPPKHPDPSVREAMGIGGFPCQLRGTDSSES